MSKSQSKASKVKLGSTGNDGNIPIISSDGLFLSAVSSGKQFQGLETGPKLTYLSATGSTNSLLNNQWR